VARSRLTVAVHKFTSCDGCQLALLNMGPALLQLAEQVDFVHFPEAGPIAPERQVDLALVEGSISTIEEVSRIQAVRKQCRYLVTIGSCATSGGIQALRHGHDIQQWMQDIYASATVINALQRSTAISDHVSVDWQLWGCPINQRQISQLLHAMMCGVTPVDYAEKLCLECKRQQNVCIMVTQGEPCMGGVTRTGCGALCPQFGRACYACYGPAENSNSQALVNRFEGLGLVSPEIAQRFQVITSQAPEFVTVAESLRRTGG